MPKKVKMGVGMMEHTQLQYDLTANGGEVEWQASIEHMMKSFVGPDDRRDQVAAKIQALLEASGLPDPGVAALNHEVYGHLSEDSAQYIGAHWLMSYHRLVSEREELAGTAKPSNIELIVMHAEELGRLQERLYWRQGFDEATGKRRETISFSGLKQFKGGQRGGAMRTKRSFLIEYGVEAQKFVDDLHTRRPDFSWAELKRHAVKRFGVSDSTIKRSVKNPKKVGSTRGV
jgi:hypothetical protein